jgi:hypothetical protein
MRVPYDIVPGPQDDGDSVVEPPHPVAPPRAECLLGYRVERDGITFRVENLGCTSGRDFRVYTLETVPRMVVLVRAPGEKICGAGIVPAWKDIFLPWKRLGMKQGDLFEMGNHLEREGCLRYY